MITKETTARNRVKILYLVQQTSYLFRAIIKKNLITSTVSEKIKLSTGLALR